MKFKSFAFASLLTVLFYSCDSKEKKADTESIKVTKDEPSREVPKKISANEQEGLIKSLQGKWKETEYPYRLAHFQESSVKFVDEGMVEEPTFKKFIISNTCPFEVKNLKNASSADIFLVMEGARTCEIIKISQNSIILSGFNITTNSNYNIVYKKLN